MTIYAIPGLGTTLKLFSNTKISDAELVVLDWPVPERHDTMQTYARKFLPQINTQKEFCLLGVSFGGMLCAELSTIIKPQKVFLVSSCKNRKELPWFIRLLKYIPIHKMISEQLHHQLAYQGRWIIGFGRAYIPEYLGMINSMKGNYFKHCIHIIATWNRKLLPTNYIHIHGDADRLLLYKNIIADYTISDGSHAMILFNATEINAIIEKEILKLKTPHKTV
jgi:hypothetical protein